MCAGSPVKAILELRERSLMNVHPFEFLSCIAYTIHTQSTRTSGWHIMHACAEKLIQNFICRHAWIHMTMTGNAVHECPYGWLDRCPRGVQWSDRDICCIDLCAICQSLNRDGWGHEKRPYREDCERNKQNERGYIIVPNVYYGKTCIVLCGVQSISGIDWGIIIDPRHDGRVRRSWCGVSCRYDHII